MWFWFYREGYYSIEILFPVQAKKLLVLWKIKTDPFLGDKLLSRFKNTCDKKEFWIGKHSKYSKLLQHLLKANKIKQYRGEKYRKVNTKSTMDSI